MQMDEKNNNLTPWPKGVSGNPLGRPVGSRTAFSEGFHRDLAEVWAEKGKEAMERTAAKSPELFFATCARLIPNDVRVTVQQQNPGNMNNEDWNLMVDLVESIKQALPDASTRSPDEVLRIVYAAMNLYHDNASIVEKPKKR
jgi:hypothetical protein